MRIAGWSLIMLSAALFAAACVGIPGIDAPVDVGSDYAKREAAMMVETDRCGPAFIQDKLPAPLIAAIGPAIDGPFRPVCARHDACYRLGEKTQAFCDDRMRDEMLGICATGKATTTYSVPVVGPAVCRIHAGAYYAAINNTYGAVAYQGLPGGEITALRSEVINDRLTDDEFTVCVDVKNVTKAMQEYDVELHDTRGRLIDREPDLVETNVRAGETKEFCVGTNFTPRWSISDLSDEVYVSVRADTPENFAFRNDMIVVDTRAVRVR